MGEYIHIEGMDLSGKTTAAQGYAGASQLEWSINHNAIGAADNPIYELADQLRVAEAYDPEIVGNVYVTALMADIRAFRRPEGNTIQDSTILLRSLAYHTVRQTPRLAEVLGDLGKEHPPFDASFYLEASMDVRRERLQKRMAERPWEVAEDDLLVVKNPERFVAMEGLLKQWSLEFFDSVVIDTTQLTPGEVLDEVNRNYTPSVL